MRILIVDDDESIRTMLDLALREEGYETILASNGALGIDLAHEQSPDVILMDLNMPVLDGVAASLVLKQNRSTREIPIIAMSAGHNLHQYDTGLPVDALLPKPFDLDDLLARINPEHF